MTTLTTYLFVPGNRPERFGKAAASGADRVILDLEDAVAPADKAMAREAVAHWLAALDDSARAKVVVRINDALSPWHAEDLQWLRAIAVGEVMLSKCESAEQVAAVLWHLDAGAQVLPLIETVRGVLALHEIATAAQVSRLAFGAIDYMLDLDVPGPGFALDAAATAIAMASRAAELPLPVAGVTAELDAERVKADTAQARALGFGAKLCIHPNQLSAVREALMPEASAIAWASRVLAAWRASNGSGAVQVDGKMVDKPVVLRAQRILTSAGLQP
ncbi:HpcH/HpaI aldolase/citrate lyase family protein [Hydrogenophaga sp. ZJX-1]|uniref:HpcH/HpaI aldolase/citrate lyase family protein n=1 Tax=Hydrogenophaga sp. ZJX-1 TaxID=3404778 RepID=UPI003B28748D